MMSRATEEAFRLWEAEAMKREPAVVNVYVVKALSRDWCFPKLRMARSFARQMRQRGHAVEVWVRRGSAGGRLKL